MLHQNKIKKHALLYSITLVILLCLGLISVANESKMTGRSNYANNSNNLFKWRLIKVFSKASVGISFVNTQIGFVCNKNGNVFETKDGGLNWLFKGVVGSIDDLLGVSFVSSEVGYVCNKNGRVYKTTDGGSSWKLIKVFSSPVVISFVNTQIGFVCSKNGRVFETKDGGLNWLFKGVVSSMDDILGVSFVSSEVGYVCNKNGRIYKSTDGI